MDRRADRAVPARRSRDHRLYAAYHLIALRGLRRGEAAGLRWCDVDLDGKVAVISQQLQQYGGRLVVCPPKTPHSVPGDRAGPHHGRGAARAPGPAARRGGRRRARVPAETGYVFTSRNGDPMARTG